MFMSPIDRKTRSSRRTFSSFMIRPNRRNPKTGLLSPPKNVMNTGTMVATSTSAGKDARYPRRASALYSVTRKWKLKRTDEASSVPKSHGCRGGCRYVS